jgi:hypothetical protein
MDKSRNQLLFRLKETAQAGKEQVKSGKNKPKDKVGKGGFFLCPVYYPA